MVTTIDASSVRNTYYWVRITWNGNQGWAAADFMTKVTCSNNIPSNRPQGPEYPVESVPTISPQVYSDVLTNKNSPALRQGFTSRDLYNAALNPGINPAIPLAFFYHESQLGTAGIATLGINNWGNLRPGSTGFLGRAYTTQNTDYGIFRKYRNYMDSLMDWIDLMLGPRYKGLSLRDALAIYAPSSDGNSPSAYASAVMQLVDAWNKRSGQFTLEVTDVSEAASTLVSKKPPTPGPSTGLVAILAVAAALLALTVVVLAVMLRRQSRNTPSPLVEELTDI